MYHQLGYDLVWVPRVRSLVSWTVSRSTWALLVRMCNMWSGTDLFLTQEIYIYIYIHVWSPQSSLTWSINDDDHNYHQFCPLSVKKCWVQKSKSHPRRNLPIGLSFTNLSVTWKWILTLCRFCHFLVVFCTCQNFHILPLYHHVSHFLHFFVFHHIFIGFSNTEAFW